MFIYPISDFYMCVVCDQKVSNKFCYEKIYENTLPGTGKFPAVFVKRPSEAKVS